MAQLEPLATEANDAGAIVPSFLRHQLDPDHAIDIGELPSTHVIEGDAFESLWSEHPAEPPTIRVARLVRPRASLEAGLRA